MSRYNTYTVQPGDTIQAIGKLFNSDWTKIAVVNGLAYPFIDSELGSTNYEGNDMIAKVGTRLVIPSRNLHIPRKTNNSSKELEALTFGSDLDLYKDSLDPHNVANLESLGQLNADDTTKDILICSGIKNLRQQLIIRLGTPRGSLLMHPEWGCNVTKYIGTKSNMENLIKIKLEVQESVLGDFRVMGISDMRAVWKYSDVRDGTNGRSLAPNRGVFIDFIVHPIEPYDVFRLAKTFLRD